MAKIIDFGAREFQNEGSFGEKSSKNGEKTDSGFDIDESLCTITNAGSLNEALKNIMASKESIKDILESGDKSLEEFSSEEIGAYIKTFMLHKLVKEHNEISSEIFLSTEYIGALMLNFLIGKESIEGDKSYKYTIDCIQENGSGEIDYKKAGDLNAVKYIYGFYNYRHNYVPADDMLRLAVSMYGAAYNAQNFKIGKSLAENLPVIDDKIDLKGIVGEMFPKEFIGLTSK